MFALEITPSRPADRSNVEHFAEIRRVRSFIIERRIAGRTARPTIRQSELEAIDADAQGAAYRSGHQ